MIITNLLTNMIVLTLHSTIPTNTPAFQDYAFHEMFGQASNMIVGWNLDLPHPITTNMVTEFHAEAEPNGWPKGSIIFSNRFWFSWRGFPTFSDKLYNILSAQTPDVKVNDAILERWMHTTNLLTLKKAQRIAESAMKSIGLPLDKLGFKKSKKAYQVEYEWTDGKDYPLPYYHFEWESEKTERPYCDIDVSGISSNVVHFFYIGYPYLLISKSTNYLEMLGLPTNAVFVHRYYAQPGKPPLYELRDQ